MGVIQEKCTPPHKQIESTLDLRYDPAMNRAHQKTLAAIYGEPTPATLEWRKIESLLMALGAQVVEGSGSRVAFVLHGKRADFHRPHPGKEAKRYQVRAMREFLASVGVTP